jgi:hypothetical protein
MYVQLRFLEGPTLNFKIDHYECVVFGCSFVFTCCGAQTPNWKHTRDARAVRSISLHGDASCMVQEYFRALKTGGARLCATKLCLDEWLYRTIQIQKCASNAWVISICSNGAWLLSGELFGTVISSQSCTQFEDAKLPGKHWDTSRYFRAWADLYAWWYLEDGIFPGALGLEPSNVARTIVD